MPIINSTRGVFGPQSLLLGIGSDKLVEAFIFGAGGGSGSSNRQNTGYRTSNYYRIKEGGAGGVIFVSYRIKSGTSIGFSVGGGGRGGGQQGNPSYASGGYNGGGNGTYSQYDLSGGGGGFSCLYIPSIGKNQNGIIALAPGGGGGSGGPGYPGNEYDKANGGGGIFDSSGTGNRGTVGFSNIIGGGGGTPTSGGARGEGGGAYGALPGNAGSTLQGANARNPYDGSSGFTWGSGGAGGGGWFGGGSGQTDGTAWSGGGGGAGSAFIRGSAITYNAAGNSSISNVNYVSHNIYTHPFEQYGDGTNPTYSGDGQPSRAYGSMRMPVGTGLSQYPGGNIAYGGQFNNGGTSVFVGLDGYNGAIVYRIAGGAWTTVYYTGSDTTINI